MKPKKKRARISPLEMSPDQFRAVGHDLVEQIADFLRSLPDRPVTNGEPPSIIRRLIGSSSLPQYGMDVNSLLKETANLLFEHSLFNGHPRFLGYITSSAAPIGALADFLASSVNPNVGAWFLSPVASEIESQTVRWIAEMIGYSQDCGGLLVSGGNMANFVCFLTARHAKAGENLRRTGLNMNGRSKLRVYASTETHTWIQKAADFFGLGTDSIRWIQTDSRLRMDIQSLQKQIEIDFRAGDQPFLIIATAGSVSTGVIDPLTEISKICQQYDLWFHVDGAYGAFAAVLPDLATEFKGLNTADSVAVDPHKWLYAPLEAGCALVKDTEILRNTFSYHPDYYKFEQVAGESTLSFVDLGMQNSRGFRALKVWLGLRQVGRSGYEQMIAEDIQLAKKLYQLADAHPELEANTYNLSIVTFRYVPKDLQERHDDFEDYLNKLNTEILTQLQEGGEAFVSNAVINTKYVLRACIVNFRTTWDDIESLPEIITRIGKELDAILRPANLK